jgi:phosphatidate cytidylyltransferase
MFKQRLITSLILIPLVLFILFYAPSIIWTGLIALLIIACGWEWLQLIPLHNKYLRIVFMASLLILMFLIGYVMNYWLIVGLILWGGIIVAELTFPQSKHYWGFKGIVVGLALILLPLVFQSLVYIYQQPQGKTLFLYVLFIVWAADIGAYLAGKLWGKHKLIPKVSPGKSWEGALGGLLLALLITSAGYCYFKPVNAFAWLVLALAMILISIAGDLFISMLKRRVGLKDTGTLIPGHGGFLDRLDSLIAVSPLFYFGLLSYFPGL